MEKLNIYISGICKGNPGKGSYAYSGFDEQNMRWLYGKGSADDTTNNQMELAAAIKSLQAAESISDCKSICIHSDSAYITNCFNDNWLGKWKSNGWKNNKGEKVLNSELWSKLDDLVIKSNVIFKSVKRSNSNIRSLNKIANDNVLT